MLGTMPGTNKNNNLNTCHPTHENNPFGNLAVNAPVSGQKLFCANEESKALL